MKIALTVGHSVLKNGNITSADGTKFGGVNEYKYNKSLASYVEKYLRELGHKVDVIICPEKQFSVSTDEKDYKLNIVNDGTYDLVVELHLNAAATASAKGTEVLYLSDGGRVYAERVQDKLKTLFDDRGIKHHDNLYMLTKTKPTAIMLETFFCTNPNDCKAGEDQDKIGKLIAEGIANKAVTSQPAPKENITRNSSIDNIKWLQDKLNKALTDCTYIPLKVDGIFTSKVRIAVLMYMETRGWNQDGKDTGWIVGPGIRDALAKM